MNQAQEKYHTAAMAFAYAMNQARKLDGQAMIGAVIAAAEAAEVAGIDPNKVGLN
jgi:hypothetical protein